MPNRLHKSLLALIVFVTLTMTVNAQGLSHETYQDITREVNQLLLDKDVGEVANQLARERPPTHVVPLLRRLSIFARAGHRGRVRQTLDQLAEAVDMPPVSQRSMLQEPIMQMIEDDDLAALRIYYERIVPTDFASVRLLDLWQKEGDVKELDGWLAARARQNDEWLQLRIAWRTRLGTAGELLDELAADVKADPTDLQRIKRYLLANDTAGKLQNVDWLAEVFEPRTAVEAYEVGMWLLVHSAKGAAKLFERSLSLPFGERDMLILKERLMPRLATTMRTVNLEKQFRYWTKNALAYAYQKLNQPTAAQTLIRELVAMKDDVDIRPEEWSFVPVPVSALSEVRLDETEILSDETTKRGSASYWIERAGYYQRRKEYDRAWETYLLALTQIGFDPLNEHICTERLSLLYRFVRFWSGAPDGAERRESRRGEIERLLRIEFTATKPETQYAWGVVDIIADNEVDLVKLRDSLFTEQKDLLPRLLSSREEWSLMEQILIENVFSNESLTDKEKEALWTQLEELVTEPGTSRTETLAWAMLSSNATRRAIPLLTTFLKSIPRTRDRDSDTDELNTVNALFGAYLEIGDWRTAEKFLFANKVVMYRGLPFYLGSVAIVAAEHGAIEDSMRIWRKATNLDRRVYTEIEGIARTKAKGPLREMYLRMKQRDPLSSAPQAALQYLQ